MRRTKGFTLVELLVVVGIIGLLVAILVPTLQQANELTNRTVCMSNLASVGKGVVLYKTQYDGKWPWVHCQKNNPWDTTPTGESREYDPYTADGNSKNRAITSLMFLLVRENQPVKLFVCPSDKNATKDPNIVMFGGQIGGGDAESADANDDEYYWDFTESTNCSYSWQAPIWKSSKFYNGIDDNENDAVVMADKTPFDKDANSIPVDMSQPMSTTKVRENMSQNHTSGKKINLLMVGMNVQQEDRPDCGVNKDNIYTASGVTRRGSQRSTDTDIRQHKASRDSFLIGPVMD